MYFKLSKGSVRRLGSANTDQSSCHRFISIAGRAGTPFLSPYHATKYAVEGISESLATEVKPLGIDVLIVEPGPFRTNWAGPSIKQSATQIDDYAALLIAERYLKAS